MKYIAVLIRKDEDDYVELTLTMEEAKRLAEKWCREINRPAYVGMVLGKFVPETNWVGIALDDTESKLEAK